MATTYYMWDGPSCLVEKDVSHNTNVTFTSEPRVGSVISERFTAGSAVRYYHFDGTGTTRVLTDPAQTTADAYLFSFFGEPVEISGSSENPYQFKGMHTVAQLINGPRLLEVGRLIFSPLTGRFLNAPFGARFVQATHTGPLDDGTVDDATEARDRCATRKTQHAAARQEPLPPEDFGLQDQCFLFLSTMIHHPGALLESLLKKFGPPRCPLPQLCCRCCYWGGLMFEKYWSTVICYNNITSLQGLETTLIHELTHALQACYPLGDETTCEMSIKKELEGYYCAGQCFGYAECLFMALGSSCGLEACTPELVESLFDPLRQWWDQEIIAKRLCRFPREPGDTPQAPFWPLKDTPCEEIPVAEL